MAEKTVRVMLWRMPKETASLFFWLGGIITDLEPIGSVSTGADYKKHYECSGGEIRLFGVGPGDRIILRKRIEKREDYQKKIKRDGEGNILPCYVWGATYSEKANENPKKEPIVVATPYIKGVRMYCPRCSKLSKMYLVDKTYLIDDSKKTVKCLCGALHPLPDIG